MDAVADVVAASAVISSSSTDLAASWCCPKTESDRERNQKPPKQRTKSTCERLGIQIALLVLILIVDENQQLNDKVCRKIYARESALSVIADRP